MKIISVLFFVAFCEFDKYSNEGQNRKHDPGYKVWDPQI